MKVNKMQEADTVPVVQTELNKVLKLQAEPTIQDSDRVLQLLTRAQQ